MSVGADSTMLTDYDVAFGEEITRNRLESSNPNSTTVVFDWEFLCMNLRAHQELPPVQAGFLLASGLTGHIRSINLYDIHSFLTKNNKFFAIAILLGCAIAHRGTSDIYVSLLSTYLYQRNIYFWFLGEQDAHYSLAVSHGAHAVRIQN